MDAKLAATFDNSLIYYKYKKRNKQNQQKLRKKPTLVFLHGLSGNQTIWNYCVEYFSNKGYPTLAIDLYGHGKSTAAKKKHRYSLENFAKDIDTILKKEKIRNFIFVGHCLGGMISLVYDYYYPKKARGFILLGATPANFVKYQYSLQKYWPTLLYTIATDIVGLITKPFRRKNKTYIDFSKLHKHNALTIVYYDLKTTSLTSYAYTIRSMISWDLSKHLTKITVPTLIIIGDDDKVIHRKSAYELANIKNATTTIMKQTDHLIPIRKPIQLARIIDNWLEQNYGKQK